jgi:uncharacterized protein
MAIKKNERAELRPNPAPEELGAEPSSEDIQRKENELMAAYATQGQTFAPAVPVEGITVIGEAVRRVSPENAEFLIEVSASAPTAAQALRDNHLKVTQIVQALQALGVQPADLQTISQNVVSLYGPAQQVFPVYGMQQIGQANFSGLQPEIQFGSCHARSAIRVNVREAARAGEIMDAATRAGATVAGGFSFKASDETTARRATLEAAGKDARAKAETLAAAAGKKVGDPISITEDLIASNGVYTALHTAMPFAFGPGTPRVTGELEYYARVSASFRLQ